MAGGDVFHSIKIKPIRTIRSYRNAANLIILFLLLLSLFLPLSADLRFHPVWGFLGKHMHVVIFACLTVLLFRWRPVSGKLAVVMAIAFFCGVLVEVIQPAFGRSASISDLWYNAIGIGFGSAYLVFRHRNRIHGAVVFAFSLASITALSWDIPSSMRISRHMHGQFPLIANFDDTATDSLWEPFYGARISFVDADDLATSARRVMRVDYPAIDSWPGVATGRLKIDWSAFDTLCLEMRSAGEIVDTLSMGLRLEDVDFLKDGDWYSSTFTITRSWDTIRLNLCDLETRNHQRPLDTSRIITLKFFVRTPTVEGAFLFTDVRLEQ